MPAGSLFEDAIDVPLWLEGDRATPLAQRMHRDREVARKLRVAERSAAAVRRWWREVGNDQGPGARLERARRLIGLVVVLVGLFAGASVALAAFQYDGTHPVNVVRVLALLVVLPLVLLVPTLLLLFPGGPLGPLQDALAAINVGALAAALARRVAKPSPEVARLFDFGAARAGATRRFARWQMLYWSQLSGVAFAIAALATGIVLVTFTDLAFGWSTTLAAEPLAVSRIVEAIAWPWRNAAPEAVPSRALIEQSQYFRLEGGATTGAKAGALAAWWPFVLLAIATYTLLPRLVLLVVARQRLHAATRALLLDDPRVTALLDRMNAPDLETASLEREEAHFAEPLQAPTAQRHLSGRAHAVIWSESLAPAQAQSYAQRLGLELVHTIAAGGNRALADDREALARLAGGVQSVLVFTPAWEPPLLEFHDFLRELRRSVGDEASIVVTPVGEKGNVPSELEREAWSRSVARVPDPRLYVETAAA